jgi:polyisoprenyl-phosphate glycosyltransferase
MIKEDVNFVVPLFNESAVFGKLVERLTKIMDEADLSMRAILVDDGSSDNTAQLMSEVALNDNRYICVFLSRNYGHQIALSAGLQETTAGKAVMVIDGDLQDPPELFFEFYEYFKKGYDVVYAVRKKRKEGFLKRLAYFSFYRLMKSVATIKIPLDSGDFSLLSRRAVDALNSMPEESRYLRGMRSWIGFKQIAVEYERQERAGGEPKYSIRMLIRLAYNGIFNFSEFPIKFIQRIGFAAIASALVYSISVLLKKIFVGTVPEGFTSLMFLIIFFSGVQLLAIGVIGEYILRIFFQVKNRPLFIVKNKIVNQQFLDRKDLQSKL